MNKTLAIITPNIGARSETFIRRHLEDLADHTIVIAANEEQPYCGHWNVDCPK